MRELFYPTPVFPSFNVTFDLRTTAGELQVDAIDPDIPIFTVQFRGDHTEADAVVGIEHVQSERAILRADPIVLRTRTVLSLDQAQIGEVEFQIFDVTGRLIRRLPVVSGRHGATWNARASSGNVVPAGVYFVRASGVPGSPSVRVVKLP